MIWESHDSIRSQNALGRAAFAALINQATSENTDLKLTLLERRLADRLALINRALAQHAAARKRR